jgi:hypothetical protein
MKRVGWMLVLLVACGKKDELEESKIDLADLQVRKIALEAYPQWAMSNPSAACPKTIAELAKWLNSEQQLVDPWKQTIQMVCGPDAPPEAKGFGAFSMGPDQKAGTADDIKSWGPRR